MMSLHNSMHSSQMNTEGPAINLRTSCWLLPQKEQYRSFSLDPFLSVIFAPSGRTDRFAVVRSAVVQSAVLQWAVLQWAVARLDAPRPGWARCAASAGVEPGEGRTRSDALSPA